MKTTNMLQKPCSRGSYRHFLTALFANLALTTCLLLMPGCGAMSPQPAPLPAQPGTAQVSVVLSSTTYDVLWDFYIDIASLTLTDSAGKSVSLYSNSQGLSLPQPPAEFIHLNGATEPLVTAAIPQGTYTSATVRAGYCSFSTAGINSLGGAAISTDSEGTCGQGTGTTTVNLPDPITIGASGNVLSLDLQVPQSYVQTAAGTSSSSFTISPVFTLSALEIADQPNNAQNGLASGINGQIISTTESSFSLEDSDGATLTFNAGADTVYQGIAGLGSLAAGMIVNLDAAVQPGGSLTATRVEVDDPTATSVVVGQTMIGAQPNTGQFDVLGQQAVGTNNTSWASLQATAKTQFKISGEYSNLQALPFSAQFNPQRLFTGQNVAVYYSSESGMNIPGYQVVDTVTLMPQTINAIILDVSSSKSFTVYTVGLGEGDLIYVLQAQTGLFPTLSNPYRVVVYADSSTQILTSGLPGVASGVLRFRGLIFDDNGTLRMDCSQILPAGGNLNVSD